jgi:hypothetical protein
MYDKNLSLLRGVIERATPAELGVCCRYNPALLNVEDLRSDQTVLCLHGGCYCSDAARRVATATVAATNTTQHVETWRAASPLRQPPTPNSAGVALLITPYMRSAVRGNATASA